jgi:formylmethanofuran dehydrogenase subunit E
MLPGGLRYIGVINMYLYHYDPVADAEEYYSKQEEGLDRLPKCSECKDPILDEHLYAFGDKLICEECLKDNHRKDTSDFLE